PHSLTVALNLTIQEVSSLKENVKEIAIPINNGNVLKNCITFSCIKRHSQLFLFKFYLMLF
ncbi:MAG: hypothetical protein N5842_09045, partial [Lactobacillus crispatus]|nr:hypothetical protein [Lactobacillus crispatus]